MLNNGATVLHYHFNAVWPALNRTPIHVCSVSLKNVRKLRKWRTKTIYDSWTEACQITQELKWKGNRFHILVSNFWCKLAVFGYPLHELPPNHGGVCASHIEGFCSCLLAVTPHTLECLHIRIVQTVFAWYVVFTCPHMFHISSKPLHLRAHSSMLLHTRIHVTSHEVNIVIIDYY